MMEIKKQPDTIPAFKAMDVLNRTIFLAMVKQTQNSGFLPYNASLRDKALLEEVFGETLYKKSINPKPAEGRYRELVR